jgi:hypothetical protein
MAKYIVVPAGNKNNPNDYGLIASPLRGALALEGYGSRLIEFARIHQSMGLGPPVWIRRKYIPVLLIGMFAWVAGMFPFRRIFFYPLSAQALELAIRVVAMAESKNGRGRQ